MEVTIVKILQILKGDMSILPNAQKGHFEIVGKELEKGQVDMKNLLDSSDSYLLVLRITKAVVVHALEIL